MIPGAIIVFISLLAIFIQDLKYKRIHVLFPAAVFIAGIVMLLNKLGSNSLYMVLYNSLLFLFIFFSLVCYMSIRNGKFINPFKNYFGLGDLLFFLSIAPFLTLVNYLFYFISAMVFTVASYYSLKKFFADNHIPLAGFSALLLVGFIISDVFFGNNFIITI